jgi:hypothetical protein
MNGHSLIIFVPNNKGAKAKWSFHTFFVFPLKTKEEEEDEEKKIVLACCQMQRRKK